MCLSSSCALQYDYFRKRIKVDKKKKAGRLHGKVELKLEGAVLFVKTFVPLKKRYLVLHNRQSIVWLL